MDRPKLELEINKPTKVELVYNSPKTGRNSVDFAPPEVHQELKNMRAGDEAVITLLAAQRGSKVVKSYEVKRVESTQQTPASTNESYLTQMEQSFQEASKLQKKFNSVNINQVAITLYISKNKGNHQFN